MADTTTDAVALFHCSPWEPDGCSGTVADARADCLPRESNGRTSTAADAIAHEASDHKTTDAIADRADAPTDAVAQCDPWQPDSRSNTATDAVANGCSFAATNVRA